MKLKKAEYWIWAPGALQACDSAPTIARAKKAAKECRLGGGPHRHTIFQVRKVVR